MSTNEERYQTLRGTLGGPISNPLSAGLRGLKDVMRRALSAIAG